MHGGGAGGPQTWENWTQTWSVHGDAGLCCMSCDVCMYAVANGTMESGVMRMGEELGRLTVDNQCFDRK